MNKILAFLLLVFTLPAGAQTLLFSKAVVPQNMLSASTVQPADQQELNFTQVMFEYPEVKTAASYVVTVFEIAKDTVPVFAQRDSTTATLIEGFEFGKKYIWYYSAFDKRGKELKRSSYYSFHILSLPAKYRIRVLKNEAANEGGLISFDYAQLICDRRGQVVWFLPLKSEYNNSQVVRNIRVSRAGTICFATTTEVFETRTDGTILWKAPDIHQLTKNETDYYHHDLRRLPSGNYMTMGTQHLRMVLPGDTAAKTIESGTLLEFDAAGKITWSWNAASYLSNAGLFSNINAFDVDDSANYVYASFSNYNTIVKIEKKSGHVLETYGAKTGEAANTKIPFRHQQDFRLLKNGSLLVFNNDSIADPKIASSLLVFSSNKPGVSWKFICRFDSLSNGKASRGGSVDELPNGNYLVNMATSGRCIELSPSKQIVWDAFAETWSPAQKVWLPMQQYSSHYVSSLYPCYFTANTFTDSLAKTIKVTIHNEGTEPDAYFVEYKTNDGSYAQPVSSSWVGAGGRNSLLLTMPAEKTITEIRVRSQINPRFVRVLSLE